jgi:glutathione synthase/RimK-type ligase-like ATP-grasp enzyme
MKKLIVLTDENRQFLISIPDLRNYISMDIKKIRDYFAARGYQVTIQKFSELDINQDYEGVFIIYQTSEGPGCFYKRYIEDIILFLEQRGAIVLPNHELLKAHHNKIFMEMMRSRFQDETLQSVPSFCYGSWVDARNYNLSFPVVIKRCSSSGSDGVFLAKNKNEFDKLVKKAGKVLIAESIAGIFIYSLKQSVKRILKFMDPSKARYLEYNTAPVSTAIVVQPFIAGLHGDYKVLIFGRKYYTLYRKNRENDFRASGSGMFFDVPSEEHEGLLNFARKITTEIDFPIFGIDIAFDNKDYHLLEFQMLHLGTPPLQRSRYWHEFHDGKWIKYDGSSDLEEEFSRSIDDYICSKY